MTLDEDPVLVCEYDPIWPSCFAALAARVRAALGEIIINVEHIGSTAVPDLAAKPIVDLDVVVSPTHVEEAIRRIASLGYVHEGDIGITGREAFRWPPGEKRHHLYILAEGSAELRRHITFRDVLRGDPTLRLQYAALKRSLTERHKSDRNAYTEAKSVFIDAALESQGIK